MTAKELDRFQADFFVMCPPCQPFTRQGKREDCRDHRTDSFFHLLSLLPQLTHKVKYIFVENVQGFEESETRKYLLQTLKACDMDFREFLVSPTQFSIPNSRLRYYLLAKLESESEFTFPPSCSGKPFTFYPPTHKQETKPSPTQEGVENIEPLSKFCRDHYLGGPEFERYAVPERICAKYITGMDIVTVGDSHTCCFTKAYGHYVVGTGSILQQNGNVSLDSVYQRYLSLSSNHQSLEEECISQVSPRTPKDNILTSGEEDVKVDAYQLPSSDVLPLPQSENEPLSKDPSVGEDISKLLSTLGLRYFTEYEIAALHAFPPSFSFPDSTTLRQRYKALGNSLNIHVVQTLMQCLFNEASS